MVPILKLLSSLLWLGQLPCDCDTYTSLYSHNYSCRWLANLSLWNAPLQTVLACLLTGSSPNPPKMASSTSKTLTQKDRSSLKSYRVGIRESHVQHVWKIHCRTSKHESFTLFWPCYKPTSNRSISPAP